MRDTTAASSTIVRRKGGSKAISACGKLVTAERPRERDAENDDESDDEYDDDVDVECVLRGEATKFCARSLTPTTLTTRDK